MTVTKDQAQMLATLAAASRPNGARRWDTAGIMAALAKVADRSLPEVILATIRAAADRDVDNPGVIPSAGTHWQETGTVRVRTLDVAPLGSRCTICGDPGDRHRLTDHKFSRPKPKDDPEALHTVVEAVKAEVQPGPQMQPPPELPERCITDGCTRGHGHTGPHTGTHQGPAEHDESERGAT